MKKDCSCNMKGGASGRKPRKLRLKNPSLEEPESEPLGGIPIEMPTPNVDLVNRRLNNLLTGNSARLLLNGNVDILDDVFVLYSSIQPNQVSPANRMRLLYLTNTGNDNQPVSRNSRILNKILRTMLKPSFRGAIINDDIDFINDMENIITQLGDYIDSGNLDSLRNLEMNDGINLFID